MEENSKQGGIAACIQRTLADDYAALGLDSDTLAITDEQIAEVLSQAATEHEHEAHDLVRGRPDFDWDLDWDDPADNFFVPDDPEPYDFLAEKKAAKELRDSVEARYSAYYKALPDGWDKSLPSRMVERWILECARGESSAEELVKYKLDNWKRSFGETVEIGGPRPHVGSKFDTDLHLAEAKNKSLDTTGKVVTLEMVLAVTGLAVDQARQEELNNETLHRLLARDHAEKERDSRAVDTDPKLAQALESVWLSEVVAEDLIWRIDGLLVALGNLLLWAAAKSGKTTMLVNLLKCLTVSGVKFLDRWDVVPVDEGRTVGVLNYEMVPEQFAQWCSAHGVDADRVRIWNLRGLPNPLGSAAARARLAVELKLHGVQVLVIDTYSRAMTARDETTTQVPSSGSSTWTS